MQLTRRAATLVAGIPLVLTGLTVTGIPAAHAAVDSHPGDIGATWLVDELVDGLQPSSFGTPDVGLSIDTALALDAIGGHGSEVDDIGDAVGPKVVETGEGHYGYAVSDEYSYDWEDPEAPGVFAQVGRYAAGFAKSLYFAQVNGIADIPAWAGTDLVAGLEDLVTGTGVTVGRVQDDSSFGDYANTLTQAFTAASLATAGSPAAGSALDFLLEQQCSAGYFRLYMTADKLAADQSCNGGRSSGASAPDTDATALTVLLLDSIGSDTAKVGRAIGKAESWLLGQQRADGSFGGGTSTEGANANSTGLAGWALGALGDTEAAEKAAVWVRAHQADDLAGCPTGLAGETGAIAYDDEALAVGRASGIASGARDKWRRAAAQALPVLRYAPDATPVLAVEGPAGYRKQASSATYAVSGVVPGDQVCVTVGNVKVPAAAGLDGAVDVPVTLPAGTADRTVTVTDRAGTSRTVTTKVLGATTLKVTPAKKKVKKGKKVSVTVTGLAPQEKVTLTLRKKQVASGAATAAGTFTAKVKVGKKTGKAPLAAQGEFDIRSGTAKVKVKKR